jgi:hypothetical protein
MNREIANDAFSFQMAPLAVQRGVFLFREGISRMPAIGT